MVLHDIRFATPKAPRHQLVLYAQSLDELVAGDAPVRALAALLEEIDWRDWEGHYEGIGQPPIHPRYLASAILFGLMTRVRSTRELEMAACKNLDFIWLLEGFAPDHSTFGKFRVRHAGAIKDLQVQIATMLVVKREKALLELIIDGTRLRADSDRHGARTAKTIEAVVQELDLRLEEMKRNDGATVPQTGILEGVGAPGDEAEQVEWLDKEIARLEEKREKYQKALGIARERDARAEAHDGKNAKPVRVPVSDPESQVAPNKEGGYAPNYTPVAAIDAETGAILYADVLEGSNEADAVLPAVAAAEALAGEKPAAVLADGNFATGEVLAQLDALEVEAYMPTRSASPADNPALRPDPDVAVAEADAQRLPRTGGKFSRTAFVYDAQTDTYRCPAGNTMPPVKQGKTKTGAASTVYQCDACTGCPFAKDCLNKKATHRTITRDEHEPLREAADQRMATEEGKAVYKKRAPGIEGVFGIIKACMGIRRFARRGLEKVRCDWNWICTAYNLKKLFAWEARHATSPSGIGS
jgi:transposase